MMLRGWDHISRGLFYLTVWMTFAPVSIGALGALLFGLIGLIAGFVGAVALGMWGYARYLELHLRRIVKEGAL